MSKATVFVSVITLSLAACLGPNPRLLEDCGEKWVVEAEGAQYQPHDSPFVRNVCAEISPGNCVPAHGEMCLNRDQAKDLVENPEGAVYQALAAQAVAHCKEVAINKGAIWDTCDDSPGDPSYEGRCFLDVGLCEGGYSTETGGETGAGESETDGPPAALPLDGIACDDDVCLVPESVIESVLSADQATLWADGTTFAPHYVDGRQNGWEIDGVHAANIGGALGFENGDVVTTVGLISMNSWSAVVAAANGALSASRLPVAYERDGRLETITLVWAP